MLHQPTRQTAHLTLEEILDTRLPRLAAGGFQDMTVRKPPGGLQVNVVMPDTFEFERREWRRKI